MELRVQGTFGGKLFKFIVFFKKALLCFRSTGRHVGAGLSGALVISKRKRLSVISTIALNISPATFIAHFALRSL